MSLRNALLPLVAEIRRIPFELGLRRVRVWIRAEASTSPFGTGGVVVGSDVEITPRPRVVATREKPGWSGGAIAPAYDGRAARRAFTIGPIVRTHAVGGVAVHDLFPAAATPSARPLIILAEDEDSGEIGVEPVAFKVERVVVKQFSLYLEAIEADEAT
jgi:hypothetical protein